MNFTERSDNYKIMEWEENQFSDRIWSILVCAISLNYIHKISLENGSNVYLVPEDFYLTAKSSINLKG